jgi:hypothetical protein
MKDETDTIEVDAFLYILEEVNLNNGILPSMLVALQNYEIAKLFIEKVGKIDRMASKFINREAFFANIEKVHTLEVSEDSIDLLDGTNYKKINLELFDVGLPESLKEVKSIIMQGGSKGLEKVFGLLEGKKPSKRPRKEQIIFDKLSSVNEIQFLNWTKELSFPLLEEAGEIFVQGAEFFNAKKLEAVRGKCFIESQEIFLPNLQKVIGDLYIANCFFPEISNLKIVHGDIYFGKVEKEFFNRFNCRVGGRIFIRENASVCRDHLLKIGKRELAMVVSSTGFSHSP